MLLKSTLLLSTTFTLIYRPFFLSLFFISVLCPLSLCVCSQYVVGRTVNGTTYAGIRARTTGAPQNHWFGPAGDPRGAGIGTKEAIQLVWSCHREIIQDVGPIPKNWSVPEAT